MKIEVHATLERADDDPETPTPREVVAALTELGFNSADIDIHWEHDE